MSNRLRLRGSVTLSTPQDVLTVKDVKDFLVALEQMNVPETAELIDGFLHFDWSSETVDVIQCADHSETEKEKLDFILLIHECNSQGLGHTH